MENDRERERWNVSRLISETRIGDVDADAASTEFVIQLFGGGETIMWIDFRIAEVIGTVVEDGTGAMRMGHAMAIRTLPRAANGRKFFNRRGSSFSPDPVYTMDDAELIAVGFVKWDGCTQFHMSHVHVDGRAELDAMFAAICKARELAAGAMTPSGYGNVRDEYDLEPPTTHGPDGLVADGSAA